MSAWSVARATPPNREGVMRMLTEGETCQGAGCAFGSFDAPSTTAFSISSWRC